MKNANTVGTAAAMRAALEDILEKIDAWRTDCTMEHWQYSQLFDICDAALAAPPEPPSNAAAMREALGKNTEEAYLLLDILPDEMISAIDAASNVLEESEAALSAPARNCDVGTADEQAERFDAECKRHDHCTPCPVHAVWGDFKGMPKSCQLIWAQMPFAKAEGGEHANA